MAKLLRMLTWAVIAFGIPLTAVTGERGAGPLPEQGAICLKRGQLTRSLSPVDLWYSIAACVANENYDEAIFEYALAGSFAQFDTMRVADETAHQVTHALAASGLAQLSDAQLANFRERARMTQGNETHLKRLCADVLRVGPPQYFPTYMVQHGLSAMKPQTDESPLVDGFDASRAWPQAVQGYLQCP